MRCPSGIPCPYTCPYACRYTCLYAGTHARGALLASAMLERCAAATNSCSRCYGHNYLGHDYLGHDYVLASATLGHSAAAMNSCSMCMRTHVHACTHACTQESAQLFTKKLAPGTWEKMGKPKLNQVREPSMCACTRTHGLGRKWASQSLTRYASHACVHIQGATTLRIAICGALTEYSWRSRASSRW